MDNELNVSILRQRFIDAMENDLDTPKAVAVLREIGRAILEAPEDDDIREAQATLRELSDVLGLTLGAA